VPPAPTGGGLAPVDRKRFGIEEFRGEMTLDRMRQAVGIRDHALARGEGPLGCLDQAVNVIETLGLRDAQALEQREDDQ